jgi:hypothetical protein
MRLLNLLMSVSRKLSPHRRRIAAKRRLEATLRAHGISARRATQITNHYFHF